jgi:hypothetical protein
MVISHLILLRIRNVGQVSGENPVTYFLLNVFFPENRAVLEIKGKGIVEPERLHKTKWRMCIACWLHKPKNTHSAFVIHFASPLQQWLHECAPIVTLYVHCLPFCILYKHNQKSSMFHKCVLNGNSVYTIKPTNARL